MKRLSARRLWPVLFFSVVAIVFFHRLLVFGEVFLPGESLFGFPPWNMFKSEGPWLQFDLLVQELPWHVFTARWLKSGIVPLWTPDILCGAPFAGASQPAVFFPLNVVFLAVDVLQAFGLAVIVKLLLLLSGTYLWLRAMGLAVTPSLLGAAAFSLGGYNQQGMARQMSNVTVCLPWFCFVSCRSTKGSIAAYGAAGGIILGLGILGGHPETIFYTVAMSLTYAVFVHRRSLKRCLIFTGTTLSLGLLTGAVQLFTFIDYLSQSQVFAHRMHHVSSVPGIPLRGIVHLIVPDFSGNPADGNYPASRLAYYELASGYGGGITCAMALWAVIFMARNRSVTFFTCWFFASIIGAYEVPLLSKVLRSLPGFSMGYNVRMSLTSLFAMSALAAFGLQHLATVRKRRPSIGIIGLSLACLSLAALSFEWRHPGPVDVRYISFHWLLSAVPLLIATVLLSAVFRGRTPVAAVTALLLTTAELLYFAMRFNDSAPPERVCPSTEGIQFLRRHESGGRIAAIGQAIYPNLCTVYGLRDVRGYDSMSPKRYVEVLGLVDPALLKRSPDHLLQTVLLNRFDSNLIDLLGVRFLILPLSEKEQAGRLIDSYAKLEIIYSGEMLILRKNEAIEKAFFVPGAPLNGGEAVLDLMAAGDFNPREMVLTDKPVALPDCFSGVAGAVSSIEYREPAPGHIEIVCESAEAGMVVVIENALEGWKAEVNGEPVPVHTVYHAFCGIAVCAGRSNIDLLYQPFSYRFGLFLTCSGLLFFAAVLTRVFTPKPAW